MTTTTKKANECYLLVLFCKFAYSNTYQNGAGCCGGSADYLYDDIKQYTTEGKYPYIDRTKDYFESCRANTHSCKDTGHYPVKISGYESVYPHNNRCAFHITCYSLSSLAFTALVLWV